MRGDPYVQYFAAELKDYDANHPEASIRRTQAAALEWKDELSGGQATFVDAFGVELFADLKAKPFKTCGGVRFWKVTKSGKRIS